MIDLKPEIVKALRSNVALSSLIGTDSRGIVKVYAETAPELDEPVTEPYVTFFELTNFDGDFADNKPQRSEIHFQFDIWSFTNPAPIAQEVNKALQEKGFYRTGATDQYEKETKTYHKVLRYKTTANLKEE